MKVEYKTVILPVTVPVGKYCWICNGNSNDNYAVCPFFDNEGGYGNCQLFSIGMKKDEKGYLKINKCLSLKKG